MASAQVDIHVMRDTRTGEWTLLGTEQTEKSGRVNFLIPTEKALPCGLHPVKMVVRFVSGAKLFRQDPEPRYRKKLLWQV